MSDMKDLNNTPDENASNIKDNVNFKEDDQNTGYLNDNLEEYAINESELYNKLNDRSDKKFKKIILALIIIIIFIGAAIVSYQAYQYKSLLSTFKSHFDSSNYSEANKYIVTSGNSNIFKSLFLEDDLETYFRIKTTDLKNKVNLNEISKDDALIVFNEMNRYDLLASDLQNDSSALSQGTNSNTSLSKGISEFEEGKYEDAISTLQNISSSDPSYQSATNYIAKSKERLKEDLLKTADEYEKKEYFTAAINLIESKLNLLSNDKDLVKKIEDLKTSKDNYLASQKSSVAPASSSQLVSAINVSNINSLDIESLTDYLIYVDTNSQTTNVYTGSKNKWNLKKSMKCSTGVKNEETPSGVYTIQNRDEWFFSEKYKQGGKYWVQFDGDYLFHSLPYDKDKQTVLDTTLGTPASHGCIRLSLEDSKWLYDNVTKSTKVIIK